MHLRKVYTPSSTVVMICTWQMNGVVEMVKIDRISLLEIAECQMDSSVVRTRHHFIITYIHSFHSICSFVIMDLFATILICTISDFHTNLKDTLQCSKFQKVPSVPS